MRTHLLILAGTTEATDLAKLVAAANIPATLSYAGRVERTNPSRCQNVSADMAVRKDWPNICVPKR